MQLIEEQYPADAAQATAEHEPATDAEPAAAAEEDLSESPDSDGFGADIIE